MKVNIINSIKVTIFCLLVAFIFALIVHIGIYVLYKDQITNTLLLINKTIICNENGNKNEYVIDELNYEDNLNNGYLISYPEYGKKYGSIKIERIDANLSVYYGDSLEILKNGIGHSSGSYFPGEGGSIIFMGHNSPNYLRRLGELQIGDKLIVDTYYGEFIYKVYDTKIVDEKESDKLPIQKEKEILMIYTCYPFNNIGYANKRYVVYSELEM